MAIWSYAAVHISACVGSKIWYQVDMTFNLVKCTSNSQLAKRVVNWGEGGHTFNDGIVRGHNCAPLDFFANASFSLLLLREQKNLSM